MPELIPQVQQPEPEAPASTAEACRCHEDAGPLAGAVAADACRCHLDAPRLPADEILGPVGVPQARFVTEVSAGPPTKKSPGRGAGLINFLRGLAGAAVATVVVGLMLSALLPGLFVALMLILVAFAPFLMVVAAILCTAGVEPPEENGLGKSLPH